MYTKAIETRYNENKVSVKKSVETASDVKFILNLLILGNLLILIFCGIIPTTFLKEAITIAVEMLIIAFSSVVIVKLLKKLS